MRLTAAALPFLMVLPLAAADGGKQTGSAARQSVEKKDKKDDKAAPPAKVYTDEDLKKARDNPDSHVTVLGSPEPSEEPSADTPAEPEAASPSTTSTTAGEIPNDEASWRSVAAQRWTAIRSAEQRIKDLEARLQELMLDTNPNPADLLDPSRLQKREAAKAETREQIEATRTQLADAQRALEQLQEKARSAGVPASWLEEPEPQR